MSQTRTTDPGPLSGVRVIFHLRLRRGHLSYQPNCGATSQTSGDRQNRSISPAVACCVALADFQARATTFNMVELVGIEPATS